MEPPQEVRPAVNLVDGRDGSAPRPLTTGGSGLGVGLLASGATVKDCGVAVDRPAGEKLGTDPVDRSVVNGEPFSGRLPAGRPGWQRQGTWSADDSTTGRRVRSSPRPGEPAAWRRDPASSQCRNWRIRRSWVNTDAPWPDLDEAEWRVLKIQAKLHQWAIGDRDRRFDDLFNLVCDPAFLVVGWDRVHKNRGARAAGVDGVALAPSSSARRCSSPSCEMISRLGGSPPCRCGRS